MTNTTLPPLRPELAVCPTPSCAASGRIGIHSRIKRRYKCHACGTTFADTLGTPLYRLKSPLWVVRIVVTLLAFGCPIPAIVAAFGLDERTVTAWQQKAGQHAKQVQEALVCQGQVDLGQVQGDELYLKTQRGTVWMATAMSVFSRLFLWAVDGFAAWPSAILTVFRDPLHTGKRGRPPLVVWSALHVIQVIKRRTGRRLTAIERRLAHGCQHCAETIMQATQVGLGVSNTAYIERLNATFRTWLPALTRRSRTPAREVAHVEAAMFWMGVVYNLCWRHTTLAGTPAMAADLTDHVWTVEELLRYRVKRE